MPLRDHFHNPLRDFCPWHSFHANWATKMVDRLNGDLLSDRYTAQGGRHLGAQIEVDVATLTRDEAASLFSGRNGNGNGTVAVAAPAIAPPAARLMADVGFTDPDVFEVKVYRGTGGWELVAAVELISEANKDRAEARRALVVKCAAYLQQGVSVVVVDVVTTYQANLHDELCDLTDAPEPVRWTSPTGLSAVVYRPQRIRVGDQHRTRLEVWPYPLAVGESLPTVPLWLAADLAVQLELEATYEAACRSLRIR